MELIVGKVWREAAMRTIQRTTGMLALLIAMQLSSEVALAQSVRLDDILDQWKARQKAVKSARFVWTEERIEPKGWKKNPTMSKEVNPRGLTDPPEDLITKNESILSIDGDKFRYTVRSLGRKPDSSAEIPPFDYVSVFDGRLHRAYYAPWINKEYPQGDQAEPEGPLQQRISYLKPVLWAYRALDPSLNDFNPTKMRKAIREDLVNDIKAFVIEQDNAQSTKVSIWVDPSRAFAILRYVYHQEAPIVRFDMSYEQEKESQQWVPKAWKYITLKSNGAPRLSATGKMDEYSINAQIPSTDFEFTFPVGTWVTESNGQMYIQRPAGEKRRIDERELGAPYDHYVKTPTGFGLRQRANWWYYSTSVLFLVVAIFAVLLWYRRTRVKEGDSR